MRLGLMMGYSGSQITIDIDQIGDGTAKGLKVTLIGHQ